MKKNKIQEPLFIEGEEFGYFPDYPNYKIFKNGNILNINKNKFQKIYDLEHGYKSVYLYNGIKNKTYLHHRVMAITFLPNPNNYPIINHKDSNPANNNLDNLEWCDYSYNEKYAYKFNGKVNPQQGKVGKLNWKSKPINQFDMQGNFVAYWESAGLAAKTLGFYQDYISSCCRGEKESAYGFLWKFVI